MLHHKFYEAPLWLLLFTLAAFCFAVVFSYWSAPMAEFFKRRKGK